MPSHWRKYPRRRLTGEADSLPALFRPTTADELASWYQANPDATLIAGATDVGLWVTKHAARLAAGGVSERHHRLQTIIETQTATLRIGAGVTISDLLRRRCSPLHPSFAELLRRYASVQVRNAATIGGNIANGSPIGDGPPALIALGATLHLRRGDVRRADAAGGFLHRLSQAGPPARRICRGGDDPRRRPRPCAATSCPSGSIRIFRRFAAVSTSR